MAFNSALPGTFTTSAMIAYNDSQQNQSLSASFTGSATVPVQVFAGGTFTCAILSLGQVACWGSNSAGQLGDDLPTTQNIGDQADEMGNNLPLLHFQPAGDYFVQLALATDAACGRTAGGNVYCWGNNSFGQLGLGQPASQTPSVGSTAGSMEALQPVSLGTNLAATYIGAGLQHFCAILTNTQAATSPVLKCWGFNQSGQLGYGSQKNWGTGPTDMGDNLPAVALGTDPNTALPYYPTGMVAANGGNTCVMLASQPNQSSGFAMKCWGLGLDGADLFAYAYQNTQNAGDGLSGDPSVAQLQPINLAGSVSAISVGGGFVAAIRGTGLAIWGKNFNGSLGQDVCWSATSIGPCGGSFNQGNAPGWGLLPGEDGANTLTVNFGGAAVQAVSLGTNHGCALVGSPAQLECWGDNSYGQTGVPTVLSVTTPPPLVALPAGVEPQSISAGSYHTCMVSTAGQIYCWGQGLSGKLGSGNTDNIGPSPNDLPNLAAVETP
jgi:alpha-tubulin suppressor-like RCC1 family protein